MERETFVLTTSKSGAKVVIKKDLTGREKRAIDSALHKAGNISINEQGTVDNQSFSLELLEKYTESMVENLVVSVNDKSEKVLDSVLDLPAEDTNEIFLEVQRVHKEATNFGKKKSE